MAQVSAGALATSGDIGRYPGGKGSEGVYQRIICQLPPHEVYIEPFLGGGAILRYKRPARCTIGIDLDAEVIKQWRSLADTIATSGERGLQFVHGDGIAWLAGHQWAGNELVYADPPYMLSTLASGRAPYQHWLTDAEHERLLRVLLGLPAMVAISGYMSELYADMLAGWRLYQFEAMTRAGRPATECLWMNYAPPARLHDYRYLGESFRERERIRRRQRRWVARLQSMSELERWAVLAAIDEVYGAADIATSSDGADGERLLSLADGIATKSDGRRQASPHLASAPGKSRVQRAIDDIATSGESAGGKGREAVHCGL